MPKIRLDPFKRFVAAIALMVAIAGCDEVVEPLKVGTNIWPGYEPGYLARDLGYFPENEIKLRQFQSATENIRAFRNGVIDVAALTLDEALLLKQDGLDIKIFLVADISDGGDVIVSRPEFASMESLKGRAIGVENSALGAYLLARALEIHKLSFDDVKIVPITVDQSETAYDSGEVDAVVTFEPFRSRLINTGGVEVFSSREMPNEIVDVLVTHAKILSKHEEALQKLAQGWLRAVDFIEKSPEDAGEILGKRLALSPDDALASFNGLIIPDRGLNTELLAPAGKKSLYESATKLKKVLLEKGLLGQDMEINGILTNQFVKE